MSTINALLNSCLLLLLTQQLAAKDSFKFTSLPTTGNERAVMVLAPGMNMDGAFFLSEKPWTDFAESNNLGIITLNYVSDANEMYGPEQKGYYWPEQGSGKALLDEIDRLYSKQLPILIYGFSGGAQFVGRFIDFAPDRIVAWCAYSAQFWDKPKGLTPARGIVACGDHDGLRWHPSFSFFYDGREIGKKWIWIGRKNTGHKRSAKLEEFIRMFFSEELIANALRKENQKDIHADIASMKLLSPTDTDTPPGLIVPFRSIRLYEFWSEIHTP